MGISNGDTDLDIELKVVEKASLPLEGQELTMHDEDSLSVE